MRACVAGSMVFGPIGLLYIVSEALVGVGLVVLRTECVCSLVGGGDSGCEACRLRCLPSRFGILSKERALNLPALGAGGGEPTDGGLSDSGDVVMGDGEGRGANDSYADVRL